MASTSPALIIHDNPSYKGSIRSKPPSIVPRAGLTTPLRVPGPGKNNTPMDNDMLLSHIEDIVKKDSLQNKNLKELESNIKKELEISKIDLVEKFQSEINELKANHDLLIMEKENHSKDLLAIKDKEIIQFGDKIKEINNHWQEKFSKREKELIDQIKEQEIMWSKRVVDINKVNNESIKGLNDRFEMEKETIDLITKAKIDSKEEHFRKIFEKKMKKYEQQVEIAVSAYKDKELFLEGTLQATRHEVELLQKSFDSKEQLLREELQLKDRRLVSIQNKLNLTDNFIKVADMWRSAVKDLSLQIIQLCGTSNALPTIPHDSFSFGFRDYYQEENKEIIAYNKLQTSCVTVNKKQLSRLLKNSKTIIERIKAEIIPDFDEVSIL